jgi:hypothetical protein
MQKNRYLGAIALCVAALSSLTMGCELVATVDRSLIKGGDAASGGAGGAGGSGGAAPDTCADGEKSGDEADVDCGGSCATKCTQGKACSATTDCDTGFCADSVCCDTACDGDCLSCTVALKADESTGDGTCGASKVDTTCGDEPSCAAGVQTNADTCDAAGTCADNATTECGAFVCDPAGTACLTTCQNDTDCATCHTCSAGQCVLAAAGAPGSGCMGDQACDGAGVCKAANGQSCQTATECGSDHCVDTVCCDTACSGNCQSCNIAGGMAGACSTVMRGTVEPRCTAPSNVCNDTGLCRGAAGASCNVDADCASGVCGAFSLCTAP